MNDDAEHAERVRRIAADDAAGARAEAADRIKIQAALADALLKALILVNGGAMIALFTFIGNLLAKTGRAVAFNPHNLWVAFSCFVVGLILALVCHLLAFFSQDRYYTQAMHELWRMQGIAQGAPFQAAGASEARLFKQGLVAYWIGLGLATVSIAAFAVGCGFALAGVLIG